MFELYPWKKKIYIYICTTKKFVCDGKQMEEQDAYPMS